MTRGRIDPDPKDVAPPIAAHEIEGSNGVRLHATEWGRADGPEIVLVHGWSQCELAWTKQIASPLTEQCRIVTFDLRGHGRSEKPIDSEHYIDIRTWADDLAAVLDQTGVVRPVVVAWSYGGFVLCDYLRVHGDERLAGVALVGAAIVMSPSFHHIGPGLLDNVRDACSPDLGRSIPAMERFVRACTAQPLPDGEFLTAFGWNMVVPAEVRAGLFAREVDGRDVLTDASVPVLVAHGNADAIVLPTMADELVRCRPDARLSCYEGIGHMPFWESPDRFNRELGEFASTVVPT